MERRDRGEVVPQSPSPIPFRRERGVGSPLRMVFAGSAGALAGRGLQGGCDVGGQLGVRFRCVKVAGRERWAGEGAGAPRGPERPA